MQTLAYHEPTPRLEPRTTATTITENPLDSKDSWNFLDEENTEE